MTRPVSLRDLKEKAQSVIATDMAASMERLQKYSDQVELLEDATGIEFVKSLWDLRYGGAFEVTKNQLPMIRKVVGRMEMSGKNIANDFAKSNEVVVTMRPKAEKFNRLEFSYRTKFRAGGKCKVIEQVSSYKSLVCGV